MKKNLITTLGLLLSAAILLSACGGTAPTAVPEEPTTAPVATEEPIAEKPLVVAFVHSSTNSFVALANQGIIDAAESLGYEVKVFEDNFNQAEQDTLVQQFLASGETAVGFIMDPADDQGGIASQRRLFETGAPIVQLNRLPVEEAKPYITAYAGVSHVESGAESARMAMAARQYASEQGLTLHDPQGNVVIIQFPLSNTGGQLRQDGFRAESMSAPFNILAAEPAAGYSPDDGYTLMSQLIARYQDQGIDIVFGNNDQLALGAARALQEAGYTPGEDVFVIGGTCHGDLTALEDGTQFATSIEPAYLSGYLSALVLDKIINGAQVVEGETQLPATPDSVPALPDTLTYYTFEPIMGVTFGMDSIDAAKLWGFSMRDLCNY